MAARRVPKKGEYRRIEPGGRQPGTRPPANPDTTAPKRKPATQDPWFDQARKQLRKPKP